MNDDLNIDGSQQDVGSKPAWMAQLPDELKGNETLAKFKTIGELGKSFLEADGKLSKYVPLLGERPTQEEISLYRERLGIPDGPEGYKLEKSQLPEGMFYDELLEKRFRETAHQLNLTPQQVSGLYKMYQDYQIGIYNDMLRLIKENKERAVNALKNMWKGDTYTEKTIEAEQAFKTILKQLNPPEELGGVEGVNAWFAINGFGDDPVLVWFFSNLFDRIERDKFVSGVPSGERKVEAGMLDFSKSMGHLKGGK